MKKGNAPAFRSNPRLLIDKPNAGSSAAVQDGVEIWNSKADVVNPRASL